MKSNKKDVIISIIIWTITLGITVIVLDRIIPEIDFAIKNIPPFDPISFTFNAIMLSIIMTIFAIIITYSPRHYIIPKNN